MGRRLALVLLLAAMGGVSAGRLVEARPLGMPAPAQVLGLEPDTPDTAVLRWEREDGADYHICFSTNYAFADFVACFETGDAAAWPLRAPEADGATFYLTLQACRDGECTEPVRAGAIGRRAAAGWDFYAVAAPLPNGKVRLGGMLRAGPATLRFYRGAAGTAARLDSACPNLPAGVACNNPEVGVPGALVGIGVDRPGAGERGVTLQVRDTPTISFMFDDGTGIVTGGKYLMQSILDDYGVKGSFFLTGRAMQTYPGAVRALVAGGHRVGNHTWSHPFLTTFADAAIGRELDLTEQQFAALVPGRTLRPCFRAPNGDFNARVLNVVRGRGYRQITQTVSSMDYARASAAQIIDNVLAGERDGAIVSFHTQESQAAIALRTLVPLLLADGYQFGLVC